MHERMTIEPGAMSVIRLPYSEAAMHARLAGKQVRAIVEPGSASVQMVNDFGLPAGGALTLSEAGVMREADQTLTAYK